MLNKAQMLLPCDLVISGCSARAVCENLLSFPAAERTALAVDALVAAVWYSRVDTFNVLVDIGTPLSTRGRFGISVYDALALKS